MFTKEAIALAKDSVEAIKTLAERQEKECPKCRGAGQRFYPDFDDSSKEDYLDKCDCKNGKIKGKWEWKPEWGDVFLLVNSLCIFNCFVDDRVCFITHTWEESQERPIDYFEDAAIPLLPWEKIERVLEGMGYRLITSGFLGHFRIEIYSKNKKNIADQILISTSGEDRQPLVMRAVIEMAKKA